jgi:manganese transport protein
MGPGFVVAAALVGPGTVTTASVTGANYGYALMWALVFSVVAIMVLLEMSARLGIATRAGLGEAMRSTVASGPAKAVVAVLIISAIGVGNGAYEAGNITGAAIGLEALFGWSVQVWAVVVGIIAFALLATGAYRFIERILVALVAVMSLVFFLTAIVVGPSIPDMIAGVFAPDIPEGALLTTLALVGTTVVPYSVFLMAGSMQDKWSDDVPKGQALKSARLDVFASMSLTGLMTVAIVSTAAAAFFVRAQEIGSAAEMADQLEPLLGAGAKYMFALGIFAAGVTSAITAPLAAAYAVSGVLGWPRDLAATRFRAIWALILVIGLLFAVLGGSPVEAIVFAQAANGILLPVIAFFLLYVMNRRSLLGEYSNGIFGNIVGGAIVLVVTVLGVYAILRAFGVTG